MSGRKAATHQRHSYIALSLALTSLPCQLFFLEAVGPVKVVIAVVVAASAGVAAGVVADVAADVAAVVTMGDLIPLKTIIVLWQFTRS